MAIKKRSTLPDPSLATEASTHEDDHKSARHPHLQGQRGFIYQFIRANSLCTREDVAKGCGLKSSTATARVKELIDEGYVIEPGDVKLNTSNVRAKCLLASSRNAGGKALDKVRVEVRLTIDCNGVYGATAHVVGGGVQAGHATPIASKRLTLTAPHPDTYEVSTDAPTVSRVSRADTQAHADLILDADFIVIND
jgi:hypothetical protein